MRVLADYFRSEGWEIVGDFAVKFVGDESGNPFTEVTIDLADLAKDIDREFDFIGASK